MLDEHISKRALENLTLLLYLFVISTREEVTIHDLDTLRRTAVRFIQTYKRLYYNGDDAFLPACTLQIYSLLYLEQNVRDCGPASLFWAFPIDRYVG